MNKGSFFKKFNITVKQFDETGYNWLDLKKIREDYIIYQKKLKPIGESIANELMLYKDANAIKLRLKEPDHLIAKIIRKKIDGGPLLRLNNYKEKIKDLIGLRVLHLYKFSWIKINDEILKNWELLDDPLLYYRLGDDHSIINYFKEKKWPTIKKQPPCYRSIHYIIKTHGVFVEIQLRTLFEEAWCEIDHELVYPNNINDDVLLRYSHDLNRIAGAADEMAVNMYHIKNLSKIKPKIVKKSRLSAKKYSKEFNFFLKRDNL